MAKYVIIPVVAMLLLVSWVLGCHSATPTPQPAARLQSEYQGYVYGRTCQMFIITDTETGQEYLLLHTSGPITVTPLLPACRDKN